MDIEEAALTLAEKWHLARQWSNQKHGVQQFFAQRLANHLIHNPNPIYEERGFDAFKPYKMTPPKEEWERFKDRHRHINLWDVCRHILPHKLDIEPSTTDSHKIV